MVRLKIRDAAGTLTVKQTNGAPEQWKRTGWTGKLVLTVTRQPNHTLKLVVAIPDGGATRVVKSASLEKGDALKLRAGGEVPKGYFGASEQVELVADE